MASLPAAHPASQSYLTFKLGDELFAIAVAHVREILDLTQITRVPRAPSYMRGVVNVRGSAVPVVDLRRKLGLPAVPDSFNTRIIVLELELEGEHVVVGGTADSVHEVLELEGAQIHEPPRIAMRWRADMIAGLGKKGDEFLIVLDIARVFADEGPMLLAAGAALDGEEAAGGLGAPGPEVRDAVPPAPGAAPPSEAAP